MRVRNYAAAARARRSGAAPRCSPRRPGAANPPRSPQAPPPRPQAGPAPAPPRRGTGRGRVAGGHLEGGGDAEGAGGVEAGPERRGLPQPPAVRPAAHTHTHTRPRAAAHGLRIGDAHHTRTNTGARAHAHANTRLPPRKTCVNPHARSTHTGARIRVGARGGRLV